MNIETLIENAFRAQVAKEQVRNAYLLVHSTQADLHVHVAAGSTGEQPARPEQPNYMASVGKLFTATAVGMLVEQGKLSFDDSLATYLDPELLKGLHVLDGRDYTHEIKVRHLLNQTSGLPDHFKPLFDALLEDPSLQISPREAVAWTKAHRRPHAPPGRALNYTDTNYHLVGLIIEAVTGNPFHACLQEFFFEPLGMQHSYMLHYSEPSERLAPTADFYCRGIRINDIVGYGGLDYAGGGVVATTEDLLKFMKALVQHDLVSKKTLDQMMSDRGKLAFGFHYGYGIWQTMSIPVIMPKRFQSWGVVGATGAVMFYHPAFDTYVIGNFNDFACERKGVQFMLRLFHQLG